MTMKANEPVLRDAEMESSFTSFLERRVFRMLG